MTHRNSAEKAAQLEAENEKLNARVAELQEEIERLKAELAGASLMIANMAFGDGLGEEIKP